MPGKNVTRIDLAEAVYRTVGLPRHEAAELVGQVIDEICSTRAAEEAVKLSSFGIFMVRKKGKRVGRAQDSRERQQVEPRSE